MKLYAVNTAQFKQLDWTRASSQERAWEKFADENEHVALYQRLAEEQGYSVQAYRPLHNEYAQNG